MLNVFAVVAEVWSLKPVVSQSQTAQESTGLFEIVLK